MNKQSYEYRIPRIIYSRDYLENYLKSNANDLTYLNNKKSIIVPFLEHFDKEKIEADKIQVDQIINYARKLDRKKDEVLRIALVDFFASIAKTTTIAFDPEKLDVSLKELQQELQEDKRDAKALSVEEVFKIRNKLAAKDKYKLVFTFEVFYIHGVSLSEIVQLGPKRYSSKNHTFSFLTDEKKEKTIKLNENIVQLIEKHPDLLNKKTRSNYFDYIQKINDILQFKDEDRGKIILGDIKETRNALFPTCPRCNEKYPNSAEFWALVEFNEDTRKTHWLYCKDCATIMREGE